MSNLYSFDESNINWSPMPDVEHAWISILDVDDTAKIIDILLKFSANEKIVLHRHASVFNTFVVKGEHRIYNPDGELTDVRPAGTYKNGLPDIEPHREGGGEEDVIILFSLRPYSNGMIYEILDENHEVASTMTFDDLKDLKTVLESDS
ncbi:MAG TPA: regulator [Gammaproteobacteria bacterium]|jgi:hypothetical protein|nr:regulator [Verrucomicrobiaceae bacterium]HBX99475.1 regulator [Gammaproteobacteria bacterium]|tara:strand:+ start:1198 stop:1644 length:447 start_codon:yes stop_codon:yes gene_type:complete